MKRNQGFTLIELMIVLALLGILAALALPSFNGLKEDSNRRICEENRKIIQGSYLVRRNMGNGEYAEDSYAAVKKQFEGTETIRCPSGEKYAFDYSEVGGSLGITCPKHGGGGLHGVDLGKLLGDLIENFTTKVSRYDSEAVGKIYLQGGGTSHSTKVQEQLKQQGFKTENTSWSVEMTSNKQNISKISWMEGSFAEGITAGNWALVLQYDKKKNAYTVGYVPIIENGTGNFQGGSYRVFDGKNGVEKYGDQGEGFKNFDDAYEFYQNARAELKEKKLSEYLKADKTPILLAEQPENQE